MVADLEFSVRSVSSDILTASIRPVTRLPSSDTGDYNLKNRCIHLCLDTRRSRDMLVRSSVLYDIKFICLCSVTCVVFIVWTVESTLRKEA